MPQYIYLTVLKMCLQRFKVIQLERVISTFDELQLGELSAWFE